MPIAQTRMLALITIADDIINANDAMREFFAMPQLRDCLYAANSAIGASTLTPDAKLALETLRDNYVSLLNTVAEQTTVSYAARKLVAEEQAHFKLRKRSNELRANAARLKRGTEQSHVAISLTPDALAAATSAALALLSTPDLPTPASGVVAAAPVPHDFGLPTLPTSDLPAPDC